MVFLLISFIAETGSQSQTLIKRTFYHESIISGTNVEVPELNTMMVNTPTVTSVTRKSSLTTRVTLNMRKCRRRSSDVGLIAHTNLNYDERSTEAIGSPQVAEVRHSISGSPLPVLMRNNSVDSYQDGQKLELMTADTPRTSQATGMRLSNDLQSSVCSSVLTGVFNRKVRN